MTPRYRDAAALRRALEDRRKQQAARSGQDLERGRRTVVFDRVAVRLAVDPVSEWILKGGAVMEFHLHNQARMTKETQRVVG